MKSQPDVYEHHVLEILNNVSDNIPLPEKRLFGPSYEQLVLMLLSVNNTCLSSNSHL